MQLKLNVISCFVQTPSNEYLQGNAGRVTLMDILDQFISDDLPSIT
jgi:hypothetical protein